MRQPFAIVVDFIQLLIGLVGDILFEWIIGRKRERK
jgi:hypothetical protein